MRLSVIFHMLGILLMLFSMTLIPPLFIAVAEQNDSSTYAFLWSLIVTLLTGFFLWLPAYNRRRELRTRDGFIVTVLFWCALAFWGSLPFMLDSSPGLSFTDAFFESLSGWTTTGATVIVGIDDLSSSIKFYRQQLQWLGGMGIIVLAVAILPMLGVGGMQLYRAETPGPIKDSKLAGRITESAKALWVIYIALTGLCALAYWAAGMSLFDAIAHSFSTVAIGGFSTYDASIGHFDSAAIEGVAICFMIISCVNFSLHFFAWKEKSKAFLTYFSDSEFRFFILLISTGITISLAGLFYYESLSAEATIRSALFEVVSIATTTGFASSNSFGNWPSFLPFMLLFLAFVGGCAGSTGGGMKAIRLLLILKQGFREMKLLVHPNAVIPVKLGRKTVDDRVIEAVWGFFSVYMLMYLLLMLAVIATGLEFKTAFSAVGACINNLGPGLGNVQLNYASLPDLTKWILCFAMLLGRLEIFTLLVLFSPAFWRH